MWLFYALFQFPSGIFSDIKGRKITIIFAMLIFSFSYLLIGLSVHYYLFFLALILLGIGSGGCPSASISMITDIFKENRGKALGVRSSAGSLAYLVPVVATFIAGVYSWHIFFFLWAVVSFISVYLFYKKTQESTILPENFSIKERIIDGVHIFLYRKIQLMFILNLFISIAWISYMSFFPAYLQEEKFFTPLYSSISLAILGIIGFVLKPFIGSLSDRYNKKILIMCLSILTGLGTLALIYTTSMVMIFFIIPLLSLISAVFPIISSYLLGQRETKGRAGKLGFYRSSFILLASPSSALVGFIADKYSFDVSFLSISLILFTITIILFLNLILEKKEKGLKEKLIH
jgi:MFS family permease